MIKVKPVLQFPCRKQGKTSDVLSLLLFNTFLNDVIPLLQEEMYDIPKLINRAIGCRLYSDDLMVLSTTEGLQSRLNKVQIKNCLFIKPEK